MPEANATVQTQEVPYPEEASREMIEAGVFYGRKKSKTNPKMKQFVLTNRSGVEIINPGKTAEFLEKTLAFVKEKAGAGGMILVVATQPAAEAAALALAGKFGLPYAVNRWPGGALTNFKVMSKRIEYFKKLRADLASGMMDKYTKKERLELEREMNRLRELFGGLENLTKEPDILVVADPNLHSTAVREANRLKIPVVALANVDADPDFIDYLVPGNDKARKSIAWFFDKIGGAIGEGVAMRAKSKKAEEAKAETKKDEK